MGLAAGARLGPYEITSAIGEGGMGEVYQARDTRLGRTVAIKLLLPAVASDPERRARFEREARTVAALNHPHICTLHDVGDQDGSIFLVMEYVAGETLAARLQKGPLPLGQALEIARQIAEALAAAHQHGVVHRDLKPGNVMLTPTAGVRHGSPQAKLLDFGLAKLRAAASSPSVTMSMLATQEPVTEAGSILGTVPYMAPEQLEGREADARSDVFAFGAVLFEMLTGHRAFRGESQASVIAAILASDRPSLLTVRPGLPVALERLVASCLAISPAERWQSAQDIALYLASAAGDQATASLPSPGRRGNRVIVAACGLCVFAAIVAGVGWWRASAGAPAPLVTRLSLPLEGDAVLASGDPPRAGSNVAISPDGRSVVFVESRNGRRALAIRSLETGASKALAGTWGATGPFFSPDGHWIAFFTETGLRKMSLDDGTRVTVCPTPPVTRGGVWARDGTIYLSPDFSRGLWSVPATGGTPRNVTEVRFDAGESNHLLPEVLPDGKTVLFTIWKGGSFKDASVWSVSLPNGKPKLLVPSATAPRYVPPGYLTFAREGVLFAARFDPVRAEMIGDVFPALDGVWASPATGTTHYAVSQDGTLVYAAGKDTVEQHALVWVDRRTGRTAPTGLEPNAYGGIRLSPDARRVAVELLNDIWIYDFASGTLSRATYRGVNEFPVWSPDGRHIAISSSQGVPLPALFSIVVDGGEPALRIAHEAGLVQFPGSWTPDGRRLAYAELSEGSDSGWNIRLLDLDRKTTSPVMATPFKDDTPMISPDGRALAYVSDETGRSQVYVCPFAGKGTRIQVSRQGGEEPVWSRKGDELFFRNGRQMLGVRVQTQGDLSVATPAVLFEGDFIVASGIPGAPSYDVAPDGRFLMVVRSGEQALPRRLEVVLNWPTELARRAPQRAR